MTEGINMKKYIALGTGMLFTLSAPLFADEDPHIWLEEVEGDEALEWVEERNKESLAVLEALPTFKPMFDRHMEIYNSDERIETPEIRGDYVYNFWKDEVNLRGLWRRTTLADYQNAEPEWETVLDLDALAKAEDKNWVYKGADCLYPKHERCILSLSRGGADATVSREFDVVKKEFVEGGYYLSEAKGGISWIDQDNVMVMTDFGDNTMTDSGYPRIVKWWKRGTPLEEAQVIYEGSKEDVGTFGYMINTAEGDYPYILRADTFFTSKKFLLQDGSPVALDLPDDADISGVFRRQLLVTLKSDWTVGDKTYAQGSLVSIDSDSLVGGGHDFYTVVEPGERSTISSITTTRDSVLINMLNNVSSELHRYTFDGERWNSEQVDAPTLGTISVVAASDADDTFFYTYEGFLSPDTLYLSDKNHKNHKIKSLPEFFDSGPYQTVQYSAISKDGTAIPYFLVARKELVLDGKNPTLLYGYGGFEVSKKSVYSATIGSSWLDQGGIYVNANIRGGGEFGPAWHHAALKEKRPDRAWFYLARTPGHQGRQ
jgi:prolyl oligopeptidase